MHAIKKLWEVITGLGDLLTDKYISWLNLKSYNRKLFVLMKSLETFPKGKFPI